MVINRKIKRKQDFSKQSDPTNSIPVEAEMKAARERASIPQEIRIKRFQEMLAEKQVYSDSSVLRQITITLSLLPEFDAGLCILHHLKCQLTTEIENVPFQVSAFSTWEKELHKIVFDPRYQFVDREGRKQIFEQYIKDRAEGERREKRGKLKEKKEAFQQLLEEAKLHGRYVDRWRCWWSMHSLYIHIAMEALVGQLTP